MKPSCSRTSVGSGCIINYREAGFQSDELCLLNFNIMIIGRVRFEEKLVSCSK